ncbi:conserved hypothetical protein [Candidatus Methylobacter favarea]|uniref:Uncharacterized protein n=1 Tax=Candidatus Methylobacter favarea TaxID=2707345 RepID=A0A8S0XHJ0_9GAMM|nr:DUF1640 domain-containing protein [Candidatus Methylobacter favarea]CAA9889761.1 conserved hypothetical protein [Candidatus Methylobacter favarea]
MSIITFDTHTLIQKLIAVGVMEGQARVIVGGIVEAQESLIKGAILQEGLAPVRLDLAALKWEVGILLAVNISLAV